MNEKVQVSQLLYENGNNQVEKQLTNSLGSYDDIDLSNYHFVIHLRIYI